MEILKGNKTDLQEKAADLIAEALESLAQKQDRVTLAIPGGRSVEGIFKHLVKKEIHWNKVHIFMIDERLVPITHSESNFKLAKDSLINPLIKEKSFPEENVHPFVFTSIKHIDENLIDYKNELINNSQRGAFDVILISAGEDCHIGSLYPGDNTIKDDSDFFVYTLDSPKPPKERMSASRRLLGKAQFSMLLFIGESKKEAYQSFKNVDLSIEDCPAKLTLMIPKSYILTDLD